MHTIPIVAQVGVGTNNPAPSAALEITAINNDKGLLIPRVLESEKLNIESPANGLLIYQIDANFGFYVYSTNSNSWHKLTTSQEFDLIDKTMVGLGSVDNTSDANKPISSLTQSALDLKAPLASPTFTGTITSGAISATGTISATAFVGDGSGITGITSSIADASITSAKITDGTISDADISSSAAIAQSKIDGLSTSLSAKADLASPIFTGVPALPTGTTGVTQSASDNSTKLATTAYADAAANTAVAGKQNTLTNSASLSGALNDETGTGLAVFATSPTLVTPNLGTPSTVVLTNATGTATALNIGGNAATATIASTVTTNANLTGEVTSVGNVTTITDGTVTDQKLDKANIPINSFGAAAGTTAGDMLYWNGSSWVRIATTLNEGATMQMIGGIPTWVGGTPPTTSPDAPTITSVTSGDGQVVVAFSAPAENGGSTITGYTAISSPGGITGTVSQSGSGTITVSGLTNRTAYTFTITATNSVGTSSESNPSTAVSPWSPAGDVTYTILDQYTNRVPTGTSYTQLRFYNEYVDAESIDASPFIITKQTPHAGGILFYGSTELISEDSENTFRLTASTGNFDFISFDLDQLEQNIYDEESLSTLPKIVITSSSGFTVTYEATAYSDTDPDGSINYIYNYSDTGIKTLNWNNVEWIDIKTQYVKAHTRTYILKKLQ